MTHESLSSISRMRHQRTGAFEAISELGRYPKTVPVNPLRVSEAAQKARTDAALLLSIADQLEK